ncbi:MAG: hypothetical protein JW821_02985 [Deltaproteobacteria bacterium]|nr:hypothetical protein [Deltaproteobacteria bacterium]
MKTARSAFLMTSLALALVFLAGEARALPAFARKYQTSCLTCHDVFPKRNITGEAFRLNGFRFVDDETYVKEPPVELGDEAYKRLWPNAVWPSDTPRTSPFSVLVKSMLEVELDDDRDNSVNFLFPEGMEIVAAGTMGDDISIYSDIIFEQSDYGGQAVENWVSMKAWIEFQDLLGPENMFNLRWGTVGTHTLGLFTARAENTFSTHPPLYMSWIMPTVDENANNLLAFEGNNFTISWPRLGFELSGFGKRWFYDIGYVAGNITDEQAEPGGGEIFFTGSGKNEPYKDTFLSLAWKIGGIGFDGDAGSETPGTLTTRTEFWRDDSLTLALFGYQGTGAIKSQDLSTLQWWEGEDKFWRFGAGFEQKYRDLTVGGHYMLGKNEDPYGNLSDESVESTTWHLETSYWIYPWLMPYVKYQFLELNLPQDVIYDLGQDQDQSFLLVGCRYLMRPNVTFATEYSKYFRGESFREGLDEVLFVMLHYAM